MLLDNLSEQSMGLCLKNQSTTSKRLPGASRPKEIVYEPAGFEREHIEDVANRQRNDGGVRSFDRGRADFLVLLSRNNTFK